MKRQALSVFLSALIVFSCTILLSVSLCSCNPPADITDETTALSDTTAPEDTTVSTEETDEQGVSVITVPFTELAVTPVLIKNNNPDVVSFEYDDNGITVTAKAEGNAIITVYNKYSETATLDVTVSDKITLQTVNTPFTPPEKSVIVTERGAKGNGTSDDTAAIQAAVNAMAGGGTVYIPAGTYNISYISFKEGVHIRLEGCLPDATVGYNADTAAYVKSGKLAILRSDFTIGHMFYNLPRYSYCTEGCDNIALSGGMLDCGTKVMAFVLACADRVLVENCIIKDISNNHAFQITGSTNVTIKNVMFAGYTYTGITTRETIQIENTTPGAIGSSNPPVTCTDGDYHYSGNVSVLGCYFGKSDISGPHLTPVGHHGANGDSTCKGFVFEGNKVENPLYCGLHLVNYEDISIKNNTFISTADIYSPQIASDAAMISLYVKNSDLSYTASNGRKVLYAYKYENSGIHNVDISGNNFVMGAKTTLRVMSIVGTEHIPGANYVSNVIRQDGIANPTYFYTGYARVTNYISDINFHDNKIEYISAPALIDSYISIANAFNVTFSDNDVNLGGIRFTRSYNSQAGMSVSRLIDAATSHNVTINANKSTQAFVYLRDESGNDVKFECKGASCIMTFKYTAGGTVSSSVSDKNAYVTYTPDDGFVFTGWYDSTGTKYDISAGTASSIILTARFERKS